MAKEIKFNLRLNIDGKNVFVQASQSVKELQRNLMAAKTGSQRLGEALLLPLLSQKASLMKASFLRDSQQVTELEACK